MSSFYCDKCGALIQDTPKGYVTECKHYPLDLNESRKAWWNSINERRDAAEEGGKK